MLNSLLNWNPHRGERQVKFMKIDCIKQNGVDLAVVSSADLILTDPQSALDLAMSVRYETGAERIVLNKEAAIYGDYSRYTSKPLKDFIYESNNGRHFFFTASKEEALQKLAEAN